MAVGKVPNVACGEPCLDHAPLKIAQSGHDVLAASAAAVHPDLRGGQAPLPHTLDSWQMESLSAICDTFIPALPLRAMDSKLDEERKFFATSASDAHTPVEVAGLICECLDASVQHVVLWFLWLLSTRIGTLLLCGRNAFCSKFPFLHRFAALPPINREQALRNWSIGSAGFLQSLYKLFKCFCMWSFFSKADESGRNDTVWPAIGFRAPDPSWNGLSENEEDQQHIEPPIPNNEEPIHAFDAQSSSIKELADFLTAAKFPVHEAAPRTVEPSQPTTQLDQELIVDCDIVVVGSGCGGGVCAAVLAQRGHKVLVLEKGRQYVGQQLSLLEGPSMRAMYEAKGLLTTLDGGMNILAGSTVGGGTAVNWSASFRTPDHVLEEWSTEYGLDRFKSAEYSQAMDEVCRRLGVTATGREEEFESFQNVVLRKGCRELGYGVEDIPRNVGNLRHKCGLCNFGCKSRQKRSTAETWLRDVADAGGVILSGCTAERVVLRENILPDGAGRNVLKRWNAGGVLANAGSGKRIVVRAKATVVSCGALHSPILLRKSGLINGAIGQNLHLHPTQVLWGYFPRRDDLPGGTIYDGPIMTAVSKIAGAVLEVPAFYPGSFAVMLPWESGASFKERMLRFSRTANVIVITRDRGSGKVRANNARDGNLPAVSYKLCREDEQVLKDGADHALRVLIAAGAEEVGIMHPDADSLLVGDDAKEIERFLERIKGKELTHAAMATASAHQMGSCRMGVDPAVSAVDPEGETWEASGLFVADTSVFPTALGVNPMITAQSVAFCIANSVHRKLQKY